MTRVCRRRLLAALLSFCISGVAVAQGEPLPPACTGDLDPAAAVRCALARSPEVKRARAELAALEGRRTAAGSWLPSHPDLALSLARRTGMADAGGPTARNWTVTLSQELELPGKRGARLAEVDAERTAALRRVDATERDVAAAASSALFTVAATDEALALATELERGGEAIRIATAARANEGLLAPLEADLALAEATRLAMQALEVARRRAEARARLATVLALPDTELPAVRSAGLWMPPAEDVLDRAAADLVAAAVSARADLAAAEAERQVAAARIARLRSARLPNPTLSVFAQRDGFGERVLGGGLAVPLVLPAPLGPSGRGEIGEAEARGTQAGLAAEALRRRVREEVTRALARFTPELLARARAHVSSLGEAVQARQLSPREALITQRAFIEILQSHLEARLAEALALVELRRVAALTLPGVRP